MPHQRRPDAGTLLASRRHSGGQRTACTELVTLESAVYRPVSPLPAINGSAEFAGSGSRATVIDGGGLGRVLETAGGTVEIRDLTIRGGVNAELGGGGGGISNHGALLTLDRLAITGNLARSASGARGGGIDHTNGTLTIRRTLIAGNRAEPGGPGADGGGFGGGVSSFAPLTLEYTTIHGNVARATQGGGAADVASGGGIAIGSGVALMRHLTLSDNLADAGGTGGNLFSASAGAELRDSILVGGSDGAAAENCAGTQPQTSGQNLDSGTTCGFTGRNLKDVDPQLAALTTSGGHTDSRAPLAASPVIGLASECALDRDQRGSALPIAIVCDLGAVEHSNDLLAAISASRGVAPPGTEFTLSMSATNIGLDGTGAIFSSLLVPAGVTVVSTQSPGGACAGQPAPDSPTTVCPLGSAGLGEPLTAVVTVRAPVPGTFTFTSTVAGGFGESSGGNDSASVVVTVVADPVPERLRRKTPKPCSMTRRGNAKANRMTGTAGSDRLLDGAGNDRIDGRRGDDCIAGQAGRDTLIAGAGRDDISGGDGDDRISTRDGERDTIRCGSGRDRVTADRLDRIARDCERVSRR